MKGNDEMPYCIMRTEKIKTMGSFANKMKHNFRIGNVPNADISRAHLNRTLIEMKDESYAEAFKRIMYENNHKPRANAVLGIEVMMSYNANEVDGDFDIDEWSKANIEWLKQEFGEDNVISAVLHRDEGPTSENTKNGAESGHIHAIVIPMVDGKLNAKHYLSGRAKMHELQNRYATAMEPLGLERGVEGSIASHERMQKMYSAVNKTFEDTLPEPKAGEKIKDYADRVNDIYIERNLQNISEIKKLERKLVEAKSGKKQYSLEDKLTLQDSLHELEKMRAKLLEKEKELDKEREELENFHKEDMLNIEKIKQLESIQEGLGTYPDREKATEIAKGINLITRWAVDNAKRKEQERE